MTTFTLDSVISDIIYHMDTLYYTIFICYNYVYIYVPISIHVYMLLTHEYMYMCMGIYV